MTKRNPSNTSPAPLMNISASSPRPMPSKDEIGVLMTDQRMPGEKGTWLLEKARQLRPRVIRILATAYADMDAAIAAVNTGAIYKYVTKPWDPPQLENTLKRGLE